MGGFAVRCGICGDRDIARLADGSFRCRTCGPVAANQVATRGVLATWALRRVSRLVALLLAGCMAVSVAASFVGLKFFGVLALSLLTSGA